MPHENYIEAAKKILECKPSGAAIELCERVIADGFADDAMGIFTDDSLCAREEGAAERKQIARLAVNYGVPMS